MKIKIKQQLNPLTQDETGALESLIILLPATKKTSSAPAFPYSTLLKQRLLRQGKSNWSSTPWTADLPNDVGTQLTVTTVKEDVSQFELLSLARSLANTHLIRNPKHIAIAFIDLNGPLTHRCADALISALYAACYPMPTYKQKKTRPKQLANIICYGLKEKFISKRIIAAGNGNNLARQLTCFPPNELTPLKFRKKVQDLAKKNNWQMTFYDMKALRQKKAGAFLAVAQGSDNNDAGIIHLRFHPSGRATTKQAQLALVGKGICFDTGGTNLKPAKSMHGMHEDMEGSAVALGTLLALSELKVPFPVDCWLALSENLIGPRAYKQNDVVIASNGLSIEITHTDAEGRMVLADTLHLAAKTKPKLIIDYATLTGACVYSLSSRYSGAFTNRLDLMHDIIEAGRDSGERVWPFPNDDDFDKELDSKIADIKQCTLGGEADHILATSFLKRFVNHIPWLHIDLSAGNNKGGLAHIPTDITGFGVRYTLELVLGRKILHKI